MLIPLPLSPLSNAIQMNTHVSKCLSVCRLPVRLYETRKAQGGPIHTNTHTLGERECKQLISQREEMW